LTPPRPEGRSLAFLFEASRRLNRALELDRLLEEIRSICLEAVDAEAVNVLIWDEDRRRMEFQLAFNRIDEEARRLWLAPGEGLAGWIAENDRPVIVNDLQLDHRYNRRTDILVGFKGRSVLGIPIHRGPSVVGVVEVLNKRGDGRFTEIDQRNLLALADPIAVALENALLYRDLQREKAENTILYQVGLKLNQTLDLEETLGRILDLIAEVLPYDAAGIALIGREAPVLEMISSRGYAPGSETELTLKVGEGVSGTVAKSGEPLLIPDVRRDPRYVQARPATRSEVAVPMISEGQVIGALNLENDELDAYRARDAQLLLRFANQAAISVERARMHRELLRRQRLNDEVQLARRIQESFLPESDPELPGYQISGRMLASLEVGGDSYDAIRITETQIGLMVADVAGKGVPAALILASFQAALRSEVRHHYEIREVVENVNRLLCQTTRPEQFITGVYGVLDTAAGVFTYSNAGHDPPILLHEDRSIEWLGVGGLILGFDPKAQYEQGRVTLRPGDLLVLYTDGAVEAVDGAGEAFGTDRFVAALVAHAGQDARTIRLALEEAVLRHCGGKAQDDVTLLVLRVGGPGTGGAAPVGPGVPGV
jgi:sigma-B regulation protein RsbU (phosphoserine phosphatase)